MLQSVHDVSYHANCCCALQLTVIEAKTLQLRPHLHNEMPSQNLKTVVTKLIAVKLKAFETRLQSFGHFGKDGKSHGTFLEAQAFNLGGENHRLCDDCPSLDFSYFVKAYIDFFNGFVSHDMLTKKVLNSIITDLVLRDV